jgi:hypothetical protein
VGDACSRQDGRVRRPSLTVDHAGAARVAALAASSRHGSRHATPLTVPGLVHPETASQSGPRWSSGPAVGAGRVIGASCTRSRRPSVQHSRGPATARSRRSSPPGSAAYAPGRDEPDPAWPAPPPRSPWQLHYSKGRFRVASTNPMVGRGSSIWAVSAGEAPVNAARPVRFELTADGLEDVPSPRTRASTCAFGCIPGLCSCLRRRG